ncbi:MAG: phosphoenolpyruvate synthase, partial [Candidatus Sungbacteria bacterium]|nr:phosphoenolpyruvate synthase [Candidatus Sungbacteria bacterium]
MSDRYVIALDRVRINDIARVGGKNAALGELMRGLGPRGIRVPGGFALTAYAWRDFLSGAGIWPKIEHELAGIKARDIRSLEEHGARIRRMIARSSLPDAIEKEIHAAYRALTAGKEKDPYVAVRSSATAEDLPDASFAGQQESFLYVSGELPLIRAVKNCFASLFTDRAISYRREKGFAHGAVAMSVGIQRMVRSDRGVSGTLFTLDPETGFRNVAVVQASYGLGETIVQGRIIPDEYIVFKPLLETKGVQPILARAIGGKKRKTVFRGGRVSEVATPLQDRARLCLADKDVLTLASWGRAIEEYFSKCYGRNTAMDVEWAQDGLTGELFIVQARPETAHPDVKHAVHREYRLARTGRIALKGSAVGRKIGTGRVQVLQSSRLMETFRKGSVLVAAMTDPDWEPIMKSASAIVTDQGGRTSHAAIISRELGIPCIVGARRATRVLKTGEAVTVDCSSGSDGIVYRGILPFTTRESRADETVRPPAALMVNIGSADEAFRHHHLPAEGVGLGRLEFIISSAIGIHPRALVDFGKLKRRKKHAPLCRKIDAMTQSAPDKRRYYVDRMAEGIAKIASVFWPHQAIIRFSDFKSNEYRTLVGGELYEPQEENPMIGWRGASRYYDPAFAQAFALECRAIKKVRDEIGLANVVPMIPFCRTPEEGRVVIEAMARNGLDRSRDRALKIYMMCEIPSNVLQADAFLDIFDGMSIG